MDMPIRLPGAVGNLEWDGWFYGLGSAFVSGGSSAVISGFTVNMIDPSHFNVHNTSFYAVVGAMFLSNGIMGAILFLRQKPLPDMKTTVTTVKTTELKQDPPAKVETTVQQTVVQPVDAPLPPPPVAPETK